MRGSIPRLGRAIPTPAPTGPGLLNLQPVIQIPTCARRAGAGEDVLQVRLLRARARYCVVVDKAPMSHGLQTACLY
jgi:hypothetical protein